MTKEEQRFTNGLQPYASCFLQLALRLLLVVRFLKEFFQVACGGVYLQFKTNIK